jgi:shikimate kinase
MTPTQAKTRPSTRVRLQRHIAAPVFLMNSPLFLIGYRGTGKTTVGRLLADRIGWDFIDADVDLEAKLGRTIKDIFAVDGEAVFRELESTNLRELAKRERCVIATGGGIIVRDENRKLLNRSGCVVWLKAGPRTIADRVENDPTTVARRPNLTVGGLDEIDEVLRAREPHYRSCADLEIDTEGRSPDALAEAILTEWTSCNQSSSTLPG